MIIITYFETQVGDLINCFSVTAGHMLGKNCPVAPTEVKKTPITVSWVQTACVVCACVCRAQVGLCWVRSSFSYNCVYQTTQTTSLSEMLNENSPLWAVHTARDIWMCLHDSAFSSQYLQCTKAQGLCFTLAFTQIIIFIVWLCNYSCCHFFWFWWPFMAM